MINPKNIESTLDKVNGVLFTGGGELLQNPDGSLTQFSQKGKFILDYVKRVNDLGVYFPLYGVWQGFELISVIERPLPDTLVQASALMIRRNVELIVDKHSTRLYKTIPKHIIAALKTQELCMHNNQWRVDPETYETDPNLQNYK